MAREMVSFRFGAAGVLAVEQFAAECKSDRSSALRLLIAAAMNDSKIKAKVAADLQAKADARADRLEALQARAQANQTREDEPLW